MFTNIFNQSSYMDEVKRTLEVIKTIQPILEKEKLAVEDLGKRFFKKQANLEPEHPTFQKFLDNKGLNLEFTNILPFIMYSYLLTISKASILELNKDPETNRVKINETVNVTDRALPKIRPAVSKSLAKDIIQTGRKILSEMSVAYVQQESDQIEPNEKAKKLKERVTGQFELTDPQGYKGIPCLFGMEILLERAFANNTPMILKIKRVDSETAKEIDTVQLLYVADAKGRYHLAALEDIEQQPKAGFVIESLSIDNHALSKNEFVTDFAKRDFKDFILACFAAHPQYGGMNKKIELPEDEEFKRLKELALKEGYCNENPKHCSIWHIYPGMLPEAATLDFTEKKQA